MRRVRLRSIAEAELAEAVDPYVVYYRIFEQSITVVGIVHGRRHRRRWLRRE